MNRAVPVIELHGVSRSYGTHLALQPLDLAIEPGEVFGLLGPNGSGKTTTLRVLATLIRPTAGAAVVHGHDVVTAATEVRRLIGVMPEKPSLYERLSIRDNLLFWADAHGVPEPGTAIAAALEFVGLGGRERERVGELSKGWRQRVALARAIVHRPPVLLLDEPSSGLDPSAAVAMEAMVLELTAGGTTVLMNTHRLAEAARLCHRVAILRQGQLVGLGTPGEIQSRLLGHRLGVRLGEPADAALRAAIEGAPGVTGIRWEGSGFRCQLEDAGRDTPQLVGRLVGAGARVLAVVPEGDLEAAYLELMGAPVARLDAAA
ncbi:MAG: ABC transporter ATP-binding protein [Dehalococcoidia bacterium]|nr:ABC transporter ATP-binding protein [Dehalococcoidia bacterium]